MNATLTELRREAAKVVRPVLHTGQVLTPPEHGKSLAKIEPAPKLDRLAALAALRALGPLAWPPRK